MKNEIKSFYDLEQSVKQKIAWISFKTNYLDTWKKIEDSLTDLINKIYTKTNMNNIKKDMGIIKKTIGPLGEIHRMLKD